MMIGSAINESFINIGGILGMLLPYAVALQSIHSKLYNEPKHQNDKSEIE
jgi:hypothetical protein